MCQSSLLSRPNSPQHANHKNSTQRTQQDSPLLRLPAELRNTIYTYVLQGQIWVAPRRLSFMAGPSPPPNYMALLHVCREMHADTRFLPFSLGLFNFGNIDIDSAANAAMFNAAQFGAIRSLAFTYTSNMRRLGPRILQILAPLVRVRKVRLETALYDAIVRVEKDEIIVSFCLGYGVVSERAAKMRQKQVRVLLQAWKPKAKITINVVEGPLERWDAED
jgi:hypothetical protein